MPPKKRDKDLASPKDQVIIPNKADQELFLQAYESEYSLVHYAVTHNLLVILGCGRSLLSLTKNQNFLPFFPLLLPHFRQFPRPVD